MKAAEIILGNCTTTLPPQFLGGDLGHHTMIFGTSGQGKSGLLQAEALRLGIPYEELLRRMEPTPEQREQERMLQEEAQQAQAKRLNAVREAFWSLTPPGHYDFDCLHAALSAANLAGEPTPAQVKALFMMLPSDIFGTAISWGFNDTEVRERIYEFVERNRQDVVKRIEAAK